MENELRVDREKYLSCIEEICQEKEYIRLLQTTKKLIRI